MAKFLLRFIVFALIFAVIRTKDEASKNVGKDKKKSTDGLFARRFIDDLDTAQWHVAHLKESDFDDVKNARRSGCKELTFQEKLKEYRRSLQRDPSRIEFVSADALSVDPAEIYNEKCELDDGRSSTMSVIGTETISDNDDKTTKSIKADNMTSNAAESNSTDPTTTKSIQTENMISTVMTTKATVSNLTEPKTYQNDTNTIKNGTRRSGDYVFSSQEYYDDVVDFDPDSCPNVVDVITLKQDMVRNIDVECELVLTWISLE